MAECLLLKSGSGSGSDDVTATKAQVLENYTAITKDSDDEPDTGTMKHLTNRATITHETANATKVLVGDVAYMVTNSDGVRRTEIRYNGSEGYITSNTLFAIPSGTMATAGGLTAAKILAGQSAFGISGTATSDTTATDGYVYSGRTYYRNGVKGTGTMTVGSILSFSAAAYSTTQILLTWQNPYVATGKPFSGVFINYSTSGYPGTGGTRIYTGAGSNTTAGGISTALVTLPSAGTTYYFSATPYCTCSAGDIWGSSLNANAKTTSSGRQSFTTSGTFTVPAGVRSINIFIVGGGGKGGMGYYYSGGDIGGGGGGGGGYTAYRNAIAVNPGDVLINTVGSGAIALYSSGGESSVTLNGTVLVVASGGTSGRGDIEGHRGGNGGSGGGRGGITSSTEGQNRGGAGGSNGSYGYRGYDSAFYGGSGQGTTTKEFGLSTGTLYAGGGGAAGRLLISGTNGAGGAGGGGAAGRDAVAGTPGSGGGGGGAGNSSSNTWWSSGNGGSGAVVITW